MNKINFETEIYRQSGLHTKMTVVTHDYDTIEVTFTKKLTDNGKVIIDSKNQMFFGERDFKEFFQPFVNEMKVRFDNEHSSSNQPT